MTDVSITGTSGQAGSQGKLGSPNGGAGGAGGGATATTTGNGSDPKNYAVARGGSGGAGGGGYSGTGLGGSSGAGGAGGYAIASTMVTAALATYSYAGARGGYGGNAGQPGNAQTANMGKGASGGAGGTATSSSAITSSAATVKAYARATGGTGGSGYGAGYSGGAGGIASATTATATAQSGTTAIAYARQTGGAGGGGRGGASGGNGASSMLTTAVSGSTNYETLVLNQRAIGGAGGYSKGGVAGLGGNATSVLIHDDSLSATESTVLTGTSYATGGTGGGGSGVSSGGAGGTASATLNLTGGYAVKGIASATGGTGGYASGTGNGGAGGTASASAAGTSTTTGAGNAYTRAYATGGRGGNESGTGNGGAGGAVTGASAANTNATASSAETKAYARVWGGYGGQGAGTGFSGGAGGAVGGTTATATGFDAYAYVVQKGGAGGNGINGANGGLGAASQLSNAVSGQTNSSAGYIKLSQLATGGSGGSASGGTGSSGGAGGAASSALSFSQTEAASLRGHSYSKGGAGGSNRSGTGEGGAGGAAGSSLALSGGDRIYAYARATGGYGGAGSGVGFAGGAGGAASQSSVVAQGSDAVVRGYVYQTGGAGGRGYNGAAGGAGAASTLASAVSGSDGAGTLDLHQSATGGAGGYSYAGQAGAGGAAQSIESFDDTKNASTAATLNGFAGAYGGAGGNGGGGSAAASGGTGKAGLILTGAALVNGSVKANGGHGGTGGYKSAAGAGGAGGSVSAYGTATTTSTGSAASHMFVYANGGTGGNAGGNTGQGVASGGAGGAVTSASATVVAASETAGRSFAYVRDTGGNGGTGEGPGQSGGAGGVASGGQANATGYQAFAQVIQTGGNGGNGSGAASGGAGGGSTLTNAVSGAAHGGGYIRLYQKSTGGAGGNTAGGGKSVAGIGGTGISQLTFAPTGTAATAPLRAYNYANGGAGGASTGSVAGGAGGNATAGTTISGSGTVTVSSTAKGGAGGAGSTAGAGGYGKAAASATSTTSTGTGAGTGTGTAGAATANATAMGGLGATQGAANATASATTQAGLLASANASASGGTNMAEAIATTGGTGVLISASGTATAQDSGGGTLTADGRANTNATAYFGFNQDEYGAYATVQGVPDNLSSIQGTDPVLASKLATVFSEGNLGGAALSTASGMQTYTSSESWTLDTLGQTGHLILGLVTTDSGETLATGFSALTLTVSVGGKQVLDQSYTSLAAAQAAIASGYFTDDAIDLGSITSSASLNVTVGLQLQTTGTTSGFGLSYLLGSTGATPILTAPASAIVQQSQATALTGISLAELGAAATTSFTVTLTDSTGLLTASGSGITGSGSDSLTIEGSLATVNNDLATLEVTESAASDSLTITAVDQFGNQAAPATIALGAHGALAVQGPTILHADAGVAARVFGLDVTETGASATQIFTVTVTDIAGLLSAASTNVLGVGTTKLTIKGSLAAVNAALATLADTEPNAGSDQILVNVNDGIGDNAPAFGISVLVAGTPHIAAPASEAIKLATPTAITGVSVSQSDSYTGETFTVVVADKTALLSATGTGITGSGTTSLTIAGTLAAVNADLATLQAVENTTLAADTITYSVTDQAGGSAAPVTTALTASRVLTITAPQSLLTQSGVATSVPVSLSEAGGTSSESYTVSISDHFGTLTLSHLESAGSTVTGSGSMSLTIIGALAAVNTDLGYLQDNLAKAGDSITIDAKDSFGDSAASIISASPAQTLTLLGAPTTTQIIGENQEHAVTIGTLSQVGNVVGELFTVTLSDVTGLLSVTDGLPVQSGQNSTKLVLSGTLQHINEELGAISVTDSAKSSPTGLPASDTITVNATDSEGLGTALKPVAIKLQVNAPPALSGPESWLAGDNFSAITGIQLGEEGVSATSTESFTVTLSDKTGKLSDSSGKGEGLNTTKLILTGTLAQINAELAEIYDTDPTLGADPITITAVDSFGNSATKTVAVTVIKPPVMTLPSTAIIGVGHADPITGISVAESETTASETGTIYVSSKTGVLTLSATSAGSTVTGSGTGMLQITGTLAELNADIAKLQDKVSSSAGTDTLVLNYKDSYNNELVAQKTLNVTVNGPPAFKAVASLSLVAGKAGAIGLQPLAESGNTTGESFKLTLTDTYGVFTPSQFGFSSIATGVGTNDLTLTGSLADINEDLSPIYDTTKHVGSDSIKEVISDSYGNSGTLTIAVNTAASAAPPSSPDIPPMLLTSRLSGMSFLAAPTLPRDNSIAAIATAQTRLPDHMPASLQAATATQTPPPNQAADPLHIPNIWPDLIPWHH
jgi:hypothetical protein